MVRIFLVTKNRGLPMLRRLVFTVLLVIALAAMPMHVNAQDYSYTVPQITVDAFWNEDGSLALEYTFVFINDDWGHPIDYVDLGLPNADFDSNTITAFVDGKQVYDISADDFIGDGSGVAIGTAPNVISPGSTGTVQVNIGRITGVLYNAREGDNYASAVLKPAFFTSETSSGQTDLTVTFHLPPGVKEDEPRYYAAPAGFNEIPDSGFDAEGRIYYRWHNANANPYTQYEFGTSFPKSYVPAASIVSFNIGNVLSKISLEAFLPLACIGIFILLIGWGIISGSRRKLQYLPPKVTIEGHGIKRGLTAVEAAILLEEPLDKVMTMILFALIKKNAAEVTRRDPLEIKVYQPIPDDLNPYEKDFLHAFEESGSTRQKELRDLIVALVRTVSEKMTGFSRRETIAYYRDITRRAWEQVEAADTPEVKSQKYEEVMDWTMLDRDYEGRTRDVFQHQPVFIPIWWGRFDPAFGRSAVPTTASAPAASPRVPGSDFAASVVTGVQTFSSKVVGNITDFTSKITSVTNPAPKYTSSSSSSGTRSGGGCACACACAGCACACAGGGR
jgi:hypothetical protein